MKHPVIKLFMARLRALAAVERASYPVPRLTGFMTPFSRHMIRIEQDEAGRLMVVAAGDAAEALFGRKLARETFTGLFCEEDRGQVAALAGATINDRNACVFGARARHSRFRCTRLEAMMVAEPRYDSRPPQLSACVISHGFPRTWDTRPLPLLALTSERFTDLDGFVGSAAARRFFVRRC